MTTTVTFGSDCCALFFRSYSAALHWNPVSELEVPCRVSPWGRGVGRLPTTLDSLRV